MYRASTGNLTYADDLPPVRGERWDRDRFERMRSGRGGGEHDHYRFTEHDRFPGGRRDIDFHEDYDRRGPRVAERERFREDERFDVPYRRPRQELFEEPTPSEVANRALAPYRRKSVVERDVDIAIRRPTRPQYIRRQSSLDTFDRRPMPRYGEYEPEDYRIPPNVPIPLPIRERRRSPPRHFDDYEDMRYREYDRERESRGRESEEFREVELRREKSRRRRSRSRAARSIAATSVRSSSSSSFEEVAPVRATVGRKGRTKLPKRLCKTQAVIELGYPYEEEDDFIIVKRALEKEHIDEIIKISENYKEEKTTYVYEDKKTESIAELAPPPPPPPPPPAPASVITAPPPPPTVAPPHSVRSASPSRHEVFEERIEESNHIGGPLTVLVPDRGDHRYTDERRVTRIDRDVRTERDIKDEIRLLEAERRMLRSERESDFEIIERREPRREVVRVEKDRKVRKEPNPKLVAAMMATLT